MEGFKNTTRTKYMTGGQVVPPSRPTPPARTKSGPMPTGPAFEGKPDTRPTQGRPVVKPTPPAPARTKSGPMTGPAPKPMIRRKCGGLAAMPNGKKR